MNKENVNKIDLNITVFAETINIMICLQIGTLWIIMFTLLFMLFKNNMSRKHRPLFWGESEI